MNSRELQEVSSAISNLQRAIEQLEQDTEVLHDNGVDTSTSDTVREQQEKIQRQLQQVISEGLAVLDKSGEINERNLPLSGERPVTSANLPAPDLVEHTGDGPPPWAGAPSGNGNAGGN